MNGCNLLLISDDAGLRACIAYQLEKLGCRVQTASSALEALKIAADHGGAVFDCIVLDALLQNEDGMELCQHLRGLCYDAKIIMISGRLGSITRLKALAVGADVYLRKPFPIKNLSDAVTEVLNPQVRRDAGSGR
jgi:two-component system response regulator AtoC